MTDEPTVKGDWGAFLTEYEALCRKYDIIIDIDCMMETLVLGQGMNISAHIRGLREKEEREPPPKRTQEETDAYVREVKRCMDEHLEQTRKAE